MCVIYTHFLIVSGASLQAGWVPLPEGSLTLTTRTHTCFLSKRTQTLFPRYRIQKLHHTSLEKRPSVSPRFYVRTDNGTSCQEK